MCRDRECAISNVTPCVFIFKTGLSVSKKDESKKDGIDNKHGKTKSWCTQSRVQDWNQLRGGVIIKERKNFGQCANKA